MPRRRRLALAVPVLLMAGLLLRFAVPGPAGDLLGGAAYTALIYALVAFAAPQLAPRAAALAAFGWSAAMELLQLSGLASQLVEAWAPLRLITGTTFVAADFIAYAAGAVLAAAADDRWGHAFKAASVETDVGPER